jgi:hypothetical protein
VIPFSAVRDDGVTTVEMQHFNDEEHFKRHLRQLGERYTRNKLAGQDLHIEVWCEAAGMIFQLADVAHEYSVNVYSSSGFDSLTAKKGLADRICDIFKRTVILHLGDYDPSGESIFESAAEDVTAFVQADWPGIDVVFRRVALTEDQVEDTGYRPRRRSRRTLDHAHGLEKPASSKLCRLTRLQICCTAGSRT